MKINIEYIPNPQVKQFEPLADQTGFFQQIIKQGKVYVDASFETKTTVSVCLALGKHNIRINTKKFPGILYHTKEKDSVWDYKRYKNHLFKLTKKQGLNEFESHIRQLVAWLTTNFNMDKIDVLIYQTPPVKKMLLEKASGGITSQRNPVLFS